ncbi:MAG: hypothetical protein LOD87_01540 [Planifilum fulgidum]
MEDEEEWDMVEEMFHTIMEETEDEDSSSANG